MIVAPATLGMLGGGQLGRYFVLAARSMGYHTIVLEPDADAPAGKVADVHLVAAYDDPRALAHLARECAAVTVEFENPPASALQWLGERVQMHPSAAAVAISQDRQAEKRFLGDAGIPIAPYVVIEREADLHGTDGSLFPAILKTARLGYDGKGQVTVDQPVDLPVAWQQVQRVACVLEQRLPLDRELSVLLARTADGLLSVYPVAQNEHVDGILDLTVVPAGAERAADLAVAIAEALGYVGVLAVEMFEVAGELVVNELAPRPHNSGHWTLDASATSQFEQQVRAVCGLPLGQTTMTSDAVAMVNLLGQLWDGGEPAWAAALAVDGASVHLYGKAEPRRGRKMGHITVTAPTTDQAAAAAWRARATLTAR